MNPDFKDLLSEFNARGVEFLVVGAHALAAHGHVRATRVLDLWVRPTPGNAARVIAALRAFGAPLHDLTERDLTSRGIVFQIGVAPLRIDLLTDVDGMEFEEAWRERVPTAFGGETVDVISRRHLIRNKRASGRPQDLADLDRLERDPDGLTAE